MPNECRDSFIERLRCVRNLHESSCRLLEDHLVNDLTGHLQPEKRNTILLMESPHKSEVCKSYPLAGQAGAIVVGAFVGTMGEILHCEQFDDTPFKIFRQIGVMNVSRLPLQRKAYKNVVGALCEKGCNLKALLCDLKKVRKNFESGVQPTPRTENVVDAIKDDLKRRIEALRCRCPNVSYVACGRIARNFLTAACPDIQADYVPHPSKPDAWFGGGTQQEYEKVRAIVDKLRCADTGLPSSASS